MYALYLLAGEAAKLVEAVWRHAYRYMVQRIEAHSTVGPDPALLRVLTT